MDMKQIIGNNPILAVMRDIPTEKLLSYTKAVIDGGVHFFEVALNSKDALAQITCLKKYVGSSALVGAGTAVTVERVKAGVAAGADFLLSPSTDEDVLSYCYQNQISLIPGVLTPSDVSKCMRYGFRVLKLFPAGDMPKGYIKSLKGPFEDTEYVAMGGINRHNITQYFQQGYLGVGIGSDMIPKDLMQKNAWAAGSAHVAGLVESIKFR